MKETPRIQYCTTSDGVNIAYATTGPGPHLVWVSGIFCSHIPTNWRLRRPAIATLAAGFSVTLYDGRGSGLSDREPADFSLDARVRDLEAIIQRLGAAEVVLYGNAHAALAAVAYTAANPGRVSKLVLDGAYISGDELYRISPRMKFVAALENVTEEQWGFVAETLAVRLARGVGEQAAELAGLIRASIEPEALIAFRDANKAIDITDVLPRVNVPTLVIHRLMDDYLPISVARRITSMLPDAHLVTANPGHLGVPNLDAAADFLGITPAPSSAARGAPRDARPTRGLRAVLFTDLVGHTEMMSRLGDERGRAVLREHERITREVLKANGGTEIKTMGDGFMASFGSVTKAVECAVALQRAIDERNRGVGASHPRSETTSSQSNEIPQRDDVPVSVDDSPLRAPAEPLHVRVGLNAGEPIEEDGDLFGATVILASRIAAKAEGGEILVADTVRGLCSGKGFLFADRGEFVAKGFEEPVRVYEVRWRE